MYELNINRLIDQLCAANCTNGELSAEIEYLTKKCEELTEELAKAKKELAAEKEEVDKYEALWRYEYNDNARLKKKLEEQNVVSAEA